MMYTEEELEIIMNKHRKEMRTLTEIFLSLLMIFCVYVSISFYQGQVISFSDKNIEMAILKLANKDANDQIFEKDIKRILNENNNVLDLSYANIRNIEGLEKLNKYKIDEIKLNNNKISDPSAVEYMNIKNVDLSSQTILVELGETVKGENFTASLPEIYKKAILKDNAGFAESLLEILGDGGKFDNDGIIELPTTTPGMKEIEIRIKGGSADGTILKITYYVKEKATDIIPDDENPIEIPDEEIPEVIPGEENPIPTEPEVKYEINGSIVINNGDKYTNNRNVVLTLNVDRGIAPYQMRLSNNGIDYSNYVDFTNTVNYTLTEGNVTKTVYVQFKDSKGIESKIFRASIELNSQKPIVKSVQVQTNNSSDKLFANSGNIVEANISFDKEIVNVPTIKIGSQIASVTGSGKEWTAKYIITGNEMWNQGTIDIQISDYMDVYKNVGELATISEIIYDTVAPNFETKLVSDDITYLVYEIRYNEENLKNVDTKKVDVITTGSVSCNPDVIVLDGLIEIRVRDISGEGSLKLVLKQGFITDKSGNASEEYADKSISIKKQQPEVIPGVTPEVVIHVSEIYSDNINGSKVAKPGDTIYVKFTTSSLPMKLPEITIQSKQADVSLTGENSYIASYKLTESDNSGYITIIGTSFNQANISSTISEISDVMFKLPNSKFELIVNTTNPSFTHAKVGDIVSIQLIPYEELANDPKILISTGVGEAQELIYSEVDGVYIANYELSATDLDGEISVVGIAIDEAGNIATKENKTKIFDKTAPVISGVVNGQITNQDILVSFNEGKGYIDGLEIPSIFPLVVEREYDLEVIDDAGNSTSISFEIDKTIPTGTIVVNSGDAKTNSTTVSLDLSAVDKNEITKMRFSNDGVVWSNAETYNISKQYSLPGDSGLKTIFVQFQDAAGNWSESSIGYIELDTTLPVLMSVSIRSNNLTNNTFATNGNRIEIDIISNKNITTPVVKIADRVAVVTGSENTFTASYDINEFEGALVEGILPLSITEFADEFGTVGEEVINTTDGTTVTYDKTAPQVEGVSEGQVTNQDVTITFNEGIARLNSVQILNGKVITEDGEYNLVVRDSAGNETELNFMIDKTGPVGFVNINSGSARTNIQDVTLELGAIDVNVIDRMRISNDGYVWNEEAFSTSKLHTLSNGIGTKTIYVQYCDFLGNWGEVSSDTIDFDNTKPTFTSVIMRSNNINNNVFAKNGNTVQVAITANKNLVSDPIVKIGGQDATVTGSGTTYFAQYTINENESTLPEGTLSVSILGYIDEFENVGDEVTATTDSILVTYKRTLPEIYGIPNDLMTNQDVTVSFNEGTAILDGVPVQNNDIVSEEGKHTLKVIDDAGNEISVSFTIDKTAPEGTISINGGAARTNVTTAGVSLSYIDANDVNFVKVSTDGINWSDVSYNDLINVELTSDTGLKTIFVQYVDEANNLSEIYTATIELDMVKPVLTAVSITSDNSFNASYARNDNTIEVYIVSDKYLETIPVVKIDKYLANVVGDGFAFTASYTIPHEAMLISEGVLPIEISGYADVFTNVGNTVTTTTDGSTVTYDNTNPVVTGITDNSIVNYDVTIEFNEGIATLNGTEISSGTLVTEENTYTVIVTNEVGFQTTVNFAIDKTSPGVVGLTDGMKTNQDVLISFVEATATLNGVEIITDTPVTEEGIYTLVLTDVANNKLTINFEIDKTAPVIYGFTEGEITNSDITLTFSDGDGLLNGSPILSGTTISTSGNYEIRLKDEAGNETIGNFEIDKIDPIVTGISNNETTKNDVVISFNEGTATLNGVNFENGSTVSAEGMYTLIVTDAAYNNTNIVFEVDKTAPVVTGVTEGMLTNQDVTIGYNEGLASLNGVHILDGVVITTDNVYELRVEDIAGNITIVNFEVDKTAPIITGVVDETLTNQDVTVSINEGIILLNGIEISSGTTISTDGDYTLIGQDAAGNISVVEFTIDKTAPIITGVTEGLITNQDVTIGFNNGTATLNGSDITNGTTVSAEDTYTLLVIDNASNQSSVNFTIDKTAPIVVGVNDGEVTNQEVVISFNEGNAKLDGLPITSGTVVSTEGMYLLEVEDAASNKTIITFVIDKTNPIVSGTFDGEITNQDVTISFNEGTATLNGTTITSESVVTEEGTYLLNVKDTANNETIVNFTIDKAAPIIIGANNGEIISGDVIVYFNEGNATLNGATIFSGTTVSMEDVYFMEVIDNAGNKSTLSFTIDKTAPVVTGINDNEYTNQDVVISFNEGTAMLNGIEFVNGSTVTNEGTYTLVVTDLGSNATTVNFTIDKTLPIITGVTNGLVTNQDVGIAINEGTGTLDGTNFLDAVLVTVEGNHELSVTDLAGNNVIINFTIDKTNPVVTGVTNGEYTNNTVTIDFNEGTAMLNGTNISTGAVIEDEGNYVLVVTDLASNATTVNFTVDKTKPVVTGVTNGQVTNQDVTLSFNEGIAILNGTPIVSDETLSNEGTYNLTVTDLAGNETIVNFTIDKTLPIVTGVTNGQVTNQDITLGFNEGVATLNGLFVSSGETIVNEGTYILEVTDEATNKITLGFTIDKTAPNITGVVDNSVVNTNVVPTFNEGIATLNGETFVSGTTIVAEGNYELVVVDQATNISIVEFEIDKTAPVITGILNGAITNQDVTISFNEGVASLNGVQILDNTTIITEGTFNLVVVDEATNMTSLSFEIDKTAPVVTGIVDDLITNQDVTLGFNEGIATLNGTTISSGTVVTAEGSYNLSVIDNANNKVELSFEIDKTLPVVTGVTNGLVTNQDVTIEFNEGLATLNGSMYTPGTSISAEDMYTLIVKDEAGNEVNITFLIDKTAPLVTGVVNGDKLNYDVTIEFNEGLATLNGASISTGTVVSAEGTYSLVVTDEAGNVTNIGFEIDKTAPVVNGITEAEITNQNVTITYNEGEALLNGVPFNSGNTITEDGVYTLQVIDASSNTTTVHFEVDKTLPIISGISDGIITNQNVVITFNEGIATLNGTQISSGYTVTPQGVYTLQVIDAANNQVTVNFEIDKTAPVITGVVNGGKYNSNVTIGFNEGVAILNAETISNNYVLSEEGLHVLTVTDNAANVTSITFEIDKTAPVGYILINDGDNLTSNNEVSLGLSATDLHTVEKMRFSNDGITWQAEESYDTLRYYTLPGTAGVKTIYVQFCDDFGNWSTVTNDSIEYDNVKPTLSTMTVISNNAYNTVYAKPGDTVTVNIVSSENLSVPPIVTLNSISMAVSGSNKNFTATYTLPVGDTTISEGIMSIQAFGFEDMIGNIGDAVTDTTNSSTMTYDRTGPTVTFGTRTVGAGTVSYPVTFTDAANINFTNANVILNKAGTADAGSVTVTGTGNTRTVTLGSFTGLGTVSISVAADVARDTIGNFNVLTGPSEATTLTDANSFLLKFRTTVPNETITLPFTGTGYNTTVSWGDGIIETITDSTNNTHTYPTPGTYNVNITGTCPRFDFRTVPASKDNLVQIVSWGAVGVQVLNFSECTNLAGTLPAPAANSFTSITDVSYLFNGCSSLTGTIPTNILSAMGTRITDLKYAFANTGFTGTIPAALFQSNTQVTDMSYIFAGSTGLNGTISTNLFRYNTRVTTFAHAFEGCTGFTTTIPLIFQYNTLVTDFSYVFAGTRFTGVPSATLFRYNLQVRSLQGAFKDCTSLTGQLPNNMFRYNTQLRDASYLFSGCTGLNNTIRSSVFSYNTQVTDFSYTFEGCTGLSGSALTLWTRSNNPTGTGCYSGCTQLTNYAAIPANWK